ncbi:hypothetical protein STBA_20130 [Streptomyces sp. MP131-18]|nr:hypothetical protein STBA_20130 [Streptomyces sp. MP131-18]
MPTGIRAGAAPVMRARSAAVANRSAADVR